MKGIKLVGHMMETLTIFA